MRAAWAIARADIARRWKALTALTVLAALAGGVVIACVAGARRTDTVYSRLLDGSRAYDAEVSVVGDVVSSGKEPLEVLDEIAALPQVEESGSIVIYPADEVGDRSFQWSFNVGGIMDPDLGHTFEKARVVAGRHPRVDRPFEAAASEALLEQRGLNIGDRVSFQPVTYDELFAFFGGRRIEDPSPEPVSVTIVGAWRLPHDVSFGEESRGLLYLTPAFARGPGRALAALPMSFVRLRQGTAEIAAFTQAARRIAGDPEAIEVNTRAELVDTVDRAVGVQATALVAFALLSGLASMLIVGQAVARHTRSGGDGDEALLALGASRWTVVAARTLSIVPMALAGAVLAAVFAVGVSGVFPLGFTRPLEIEPGVRADLPVLAFGAVVILVALMARASLATAVSGRRSAVVTRAARAPEVAARMGLPPSAVSGLRFAWMRGRGRAAVPLLTTLSGTLIGVGALVAAVVFGASFDRMVRTPAEYGWTWDATVAGGEDEAVFEPRARALVASPATHDVTRVRVIGTQFEGGRLSLMAIDPLKGDLRFRMIQGEQPRRPGEIALGSQTLRSAGGRIGGTVRLPAPASSCPEGEPCTTSFLIVGTFVMPAIEDSPTDEGALIAIESLPSVAGSEGFSDFFVNLAPGASARDLDAVAADAIDRSAGAGPPSVEIENLSRVRGMPFALAGALGLLALATLSHLLITSVRLRRGDLAILKTLGFQRAQVRAAVAWQSSAVVAVALLVGVPVGVISGRWSWGVLNGLLGLDAPAIVSTSTLVLGCIGALLIANLVAALPARAAALTAPAMILRTE